MKELFVRRVPLYVLTALRVPTSLEDTPACLQALNLLAALIAFKSRYMAT